MNAVPWGRRALIITVSLLVGSVIGHVILLAVPQLEKNESAALLWLVPAVVIWRWLLLREQRVRSLFKPSASVRRPTLNYWRVGAVLAFLIAVVGYDASRLLNGDHADLSNLILGLAAIAMVSFMAWNYRMR